MNQQDSKDESDKEIFATCYAFRLVLSSLSRSSKFPGFSYRVSWSERRSRRVLSRLILRSEYSVSDRKKRCIQ